MSIWDLILLKLIPSHRRIIRIVIQFLNGNRSEIICETRFVSQEQLDNLDASPLVDWVIWEEGVICE